VTNRVKRAAREASVRALHQGKLDCLVLSVRSGSVGLNLTAANHVIFISPCLNAASRRQCIGRCHRIGQTRSVMVHTLVEEGTVEEGVAAFIERNEELPARDVAGHSGLQQDQLVLATAKFIEEQL
jgi:SNF2 family DNA or RNA helicase